MGFASVEVSGHAAQYLAIQYNDDERPCGWGISPDRKAALEMADAQYACHGSGGHGRCYPGEEKGALRVYVLIETDAAEPALPRLVGSYDIRTGQWSS